MHKCGTMIQMAGKLYTTNPANITFTRDKFSGAVETGLSKTLLSYKIRIIKVACFIRRCEPGINKERVIYLSGESGFSLLVIVLSLYTNNG
jgi:hypothetical protein